MRYGKNNMVVGLFFMAGFMIYGFVLIYLRDFAPGREEWVANYSVGRHFEARLAHVHGNLFAFINIVIGYLLWRLPLAHSSTKWVSRLAMLGMLMPVGILAEVLLGVPPVFVLVGGISMVTAVAWLGVACARMKVPSHDPERL